MYPYNIYKPNRFTDMKPVFSAENNNKSEQANNDNSEAKEESKISLSDNVEVSIPVEKTANYNNYMNDNPVNPDNPNNDTYRENPATRPNENNPFLVDMVMDALKDEATDADYYARLANKLTDMNDRDIVRKIHLDELKHYKMFNDIYYYLTGERVDVSPDKKPLSTNLIANFEDSFFSEMHGSEFYRKILFSFLNLGFRDYLFEIITDEQNHAQKMHHLYTKYK